MATHATLPPATDTARRIGSGVFRVRRPSQQLLAAYLTSTDEPELLERPAGVAAGETNERGSDMPTGRI